jgi:hypothetical protein
MVIESLRVAAGLCETSQPPITVAEAGLGAHPSGQEPGTKTPREPVHFNPQQRFRTNDGAYSTRPTPYLFPSKELLFHLLISPFNHLLVPTLQRSSS